MTGHLTEDALVGLALGDVEAAERERLSLHVDACAVCRAELTGFEDAVRHSLAASPAIAPPAGFSESVVATLVRAAGTSAASVPVPGVARWVPWVVAAASLLVGVALGVGVTFGVLGETPAAGPGGPSSPGPTPSASPAATVAPAASVLVTRTGDAVGTAGTATVDGRRVLVLTVTSGRPGMTYECMLIAPDGTRTSGGTWTLGEPYGSERAAGTWVVQLADATVSRVELVAPSGAVWSTATF